MRKPVKFKGNLSPTRKAFNQAIDKYEEWLREAVTIEKIRTAIEENTFRKFNYRLEAEMITFKHVKGVDNSTDLARVIYNNLTKQEG